MENPKRMSLPPAPKETSSQAPFEPMPPDIHNVYIYEVFNTASWSVVLGSPMLLFFQHLNASATILAIAACLAPVLNILQIPAALRRESWLSPICPQRLDDTQCCRYRHDAGSVSARFRRPRHTDRPDAEPLPCL
jgi:hypothetical protein